jgi:ribosomal protein S18 acetylase RimI-like enzyme
VATALMRSAADAARTMGAARLMLRTATTNAAAQALYAGLGWRLVDDFLTYDLTL